MLIRDRLGSGELKPIRAVLLAAILSVLAGLICTQCVGAGSAVGYRNNPTHSGMVVSPGLEPPLTQTWSLSVPNVEPYTISYPLIADGNVYAIARDDSNGTTNLYAIAQSDGHTVWGPISIGNSIPSAWPAFVNNEVIVLTSSGQLFAYRAGTGSQLWHEQLQATQVSCPPTGYSDDVFISASDGIVYCIKASDGSVHWESESLPAESSPCVTPSAIYITSGGPTTVALDTDSGSVLWQYSTNLSGGPLTTAAYIDGFLYVGGAIGSNCGYRMDAKTGTPVGAYDCNQFCSPALDNGIGFIVLARGSLQAEKMASQAILWSVTETSDTFVGSPLVVNHVVYAATAGGMLYGFDEVSGIQVFSANLGTSIGNAGIAAANGILVIATASSLVAFE